MQKILVTDIDSTLSLGERVSHEVVCACKNLKSSGWEIMVATGRTLQSSLSHISQIGASGIAIVYDGARCMRADGSEILSFEMSSDDALEILNFCWDFDAEIQIAGDEKIFCRENDSETIGFCTETGLECNMIDKPQVSGRVFRIAFWGEPLKINFIEAELKTKFGSRFAVTRGGDFFLDVLAKGVSKGAMFDELVKRGIVCKPKLLAAAGDHFNDFELLRIADIAAVPSDGAPALLELAHFVMPSAKEHGMKYLVEFLKNYVEEKMEGKN